MKKLGKSEMNFDEIVDRNGTDCVKYDGVKRYFKEDGELFPAWVADMDFKAGDFILEALQKKIEHGILGYPEISKSLYGSIVSWQDKRVNWKIKEENISLVAGVVSALSAAIEAFTKEGDEVIIQTPVYYPFYSVIRLNNRKIVINKLLNSNGSYKIDFDDFEKKISKKCKLFILCSPHNPVGRVWSKKELSKLAKICLKKGVKIISDEIHSDLVFKEFTPMASISKEISDITLTLNSPSKSFNLAGLNSSYAICTNKVMQNSFKKVIEKRGINHLNIFGLVALEASYTKGEEWLESLLEYLESNINYTINFFKKKLPNVIVEKPDATYLMWLNFEKCGLSHKVVREKLLKEAKVALNDGVSFGFDGKNFFRLNIALPKKRLKILLEKIEKAFNH